MKGTNPKGLSDGEAIGPSEVLRQAGRIFHTPSILSHLSFRTPLKMSPASTAWMPAPVNLERPPSSTAWMPVLVKDLCDPDVVATIAKRR